MKRSSSEFLGLTLAVAVAGGLGATACASAQAPQPPVRHEAPATPNRPSAATRQIDQLAAQAIAALNGDQSQDKAVRLQDGGRTETASLPLSGQGSVDLIVTSGKTVVIHGKRQPSTPAIRSFTINWTKPSGAMESVQLDKQVEGWEARETMPDPKDLGIKQTVTETGPGRAVTYTQEQRGNQPFTPTSPHSHNPALVAAHFQAALQSVGAFISLEQTAAQLS